jgi:Ca-activated chloride channel family protein
MARTILILTDGYVDVEKESFELIRKNLGRSNFFAFGIGSSVNRFLIEGIARVGQAESFVVTRPDQAAENADKFRKYVSSPVLSKIKIAYNDFAAYDVEPLSIPDILADRPVILFGKYRGSAKGTIELQGIAGEGKTYSARLSVASSKPDAAYKALKYLWARQRLTMLADFNHIAANEELKNEIIRLGLAYNLLTDYTSFVAIDQQVRNVNGKTVRVEQPLPLPQGVSDLAVGEMATGGGVGGYFAPSPMTVNRSAVKTESKDKQSLGFESQADAKKEQLKVKVADVKISNAAEKKTVTAFIKKQLQVFEQCYEQNIGSNNAQSLSGKVVIKFTLNKDGKISNIVFIKKELGDPNFESCLLQTIQSWIVKTSATQNQISVEFTLEFDCN